MIRSAPQRPAHPSRTRPGTIRRRHLQPVGAADGTRGRYGGDDAGKKVKGRKRHILVATMGLLLAVVVHSANLHDRDGANYLLTYIADWLPRLHTIVADGGYAGKLVAWVEATRGWSLQVVKRTAELVGFAVLPVRWRGERTFAWLSHYRRLRTDDEGRTEVSEAFVSVAMIHLMLRGLDPH